MNKSIALIIFGCVIILFQPVLALAEESYEMKPLHDGQVRKAGPNYLELVARPGKLILYVRDHANNKVSTKNATGKATIQHDKEKLPVELTPAQNNILQGSGDFLVGPETTINIFVKLAGQEAYATKFAPLSEGVDHGDHDHDHDHDQGDHHGNGHDRHHH